MYSMDDYRKQEQCGGYADDGSFITNDGKKWMSIGTVDYGNNNFFEVMVLETKPDLDEPFRHNQYPVFMAEHGDDLDLLGVPMPEFMETLVQYDSHHVNEVVLQLGVLLSKY